MKIKNRRLIVSVVMLLISAVLLGTASYAWVAMNTSNVVDGLEVEASTDSLYLEISTNDVDYGTKASFGNIHKTLRLITHGFVSSDKTEIVKLDPQPASGNYSSGNYYIKADSDIIDPVVGSGSEWKANNFLLATDLVPASDLTGLYKNPVFTEVTANELYASGTYYKEVNKACYAPVSLEVGDSVKGLFTLADIEAETSGQYNGTEQYWKVIDGSYHNVTKNLTEGSDLTGLYKVNPAPVSTESNFDGENYYYLVNGNDYSCIGKPADSVAIADYLYWGRAYSTDPTQHQDGNTLNIVNDTDGEANYYFHNTFFIRQAEGTVYGKNFKVENVKIGGDSSEIAKALRVLFVATSELGGRETCVYDCGNNSYTYGDGGDNFFDVLLGDEKETVTIDVYVYYDGKDDVADNQTVIDNNQSVEIKFSIDNHNYN